MDVHRLRPIDLQLVKTIAGRKGDLFTNIEAAMDDVNYDDLLSMDEVDALVRRYHRDSTVFDTQEPIRAQPAIVCTLAFSSNKIIKEAVKQAGQADVVMLRGHAVPRDVVGNTGSTWGKGIGRTVQVSFMLKETGTWKCERLITR